MTPKEKALDLTAYYAARLWEITHDLGVKPTPLQVRLKAKECALICVDEIIATLKELDMYEHVPQHVIEYWQDVKKEIEKL